MDLNSMNDGVFIIYHGKNQNLLIAVKPHKWASIQSAGEIADGVKERQQERDGINELESVISAYL